MHKFNSFVRCSYCRVHGEWFRRVCQLSNYWSLLTTCNLLHMCFSFENFVSSIARVIRVLQLSNYWCLFRTILLLGWFYSDFTGHKCVFHLKVLLVQFQFVQKCFSYRNVEVCLGYAACYICVFRFKALILHLNLLQICLGYRIIEVYLGRVTHNIWAFRLKILLL